jgi:hypothetical protein
MDRINLLCFNINSGYYGLIMSEPWLIGEQSREHMKGQMMSGYRNDQNQMGYVNKE